MGQMGKMWLNWSFPSQITMGVWSFEGLSILNAYWSQWEVKALSPLKVILYIVSIHLQTFLSLKSSCCLNVWMYHMPCSPHSLFYKGCINSVHGCLGDAMEMYLSPLATASVGQSDCSPSSTFWDPWSLCWLDCSIWGREGKTCSILIFISMKLF